MLRRFSFISFFPPPPVMKKLFIFSPQLRRFTLNMPFFVERMEIDENAVA